MIKLILPAFAAALLSAPLAAAQPPAQEARDGTPRQEAPRAEEARIPFANFRGGVRSFHADEQDVVYLQDRRRNWYRAELIGSCFGLPFARAVGIDTRGSSVFDRFSTLIVEGERCKLQSLTRSARPERRASRRG
jgi:hypothetical protein